MSESHPYFPKSLALQDILYRENEKLKEYYLWLEKSMPVEFFSEIDQESFLLIVHNLIKFDTQEYTANILLKHMAIVITLDQPDADLKILKNYATYGIRSYQAYVSTSQPPFLQVKNHLRIVLIHFFSEDFQSEASELPEGFKAQLQQELTQRSLHISEEALDQALSSMALPFLRSLPVDKVAIAVAMYTRAMTRDHCQYEVKYHEDWEEKNVPSMQIILAWRNVPKHNFLFRLLRVIRRNKLIIKRISASYNHPYKKNSILVLALELHGEKNEDAWKSTNIIHFIKELITVKYFASFDLFDRYYVSKGLLSNQMGNLLRAMCNFIHQSLVHIDPHIYSLENIEEGLCRHPELTIQLCQAFNYKFHPGKNDDTKYEELREIFLEDVNKLDTGHEENDTRRKNILRQGMSFIHFTLKTNYYRPNYTGLSFRLDPAYLDDLPFDRTKKFPEIPFAIFFLKGMHYFGFHIRFKDLARGGLRTVIPEQSERMVLEMNQVFTECYNLAYTQDLKNKDIPEGGAKGIIFLKPYERLESEVLHYRNDLQNSNLPPSQVELTLEEFRKEQLIEHLYQAQRSFIENLLTLINCDEEGHLRARDIVDYWRKPEYLYLGPDENMHDSMIEWIAQYSKTIHYKPGSSFISGKPGVGINHKEYGVTSLGVNVYLESILQAALGINPYVTPFTVKMSGGPDGDVAGNEICNLYRYYPNTAKIVALTDISGTIQDPQGLDLEVLHKLFALKQSIRFYPPEKLNSGGFLIDKTTRRQVSNLVQQTLCWRNKEGTLVQDWLSGSEMNYLIRHNVHQTPADVFIPAGGRPRTLNDKNYKEFLDATGKPTARAIIEGANLYLTPKARKALEELGVLIVKDSSANKTGVICSSFEVLCGLTLGDERFLEHKEQLVKEILVRLKECAANEAALLLRTRNERHQFLTDISDEISTRINDFFNQILSFLNDVTLSKDPRDPYLRCFLDYCLPYLRTHFQEELINSIPDLHKKAIIACQISSKLVYEKSLAWSPSLIDILPILLKE